MMVWGVAYSSVKVIFGSKLLVERSRISTYTPLLVSVNDRNKVVALGLRNLTIYRVRCTFRAIDDYFIELALISNRDGDSCVNSWD